MTQEGEEEEEELLCLYKKECKILIVNYHQSRVTGKESLLQSGSASGTMNPHLDTVPRDRDKDEERGFTVAFSTAADVAAFNISVITSHKS